jgi:hypothetical protein
VGIARRERFSPALTARLIVEEHLKASWTTVLDNSVADPDPGHGAFLTPGSGSGMGKNQDPDPG